MIDNKSLSLDERNELYFATRRKNERWLETHYDLRSLEGINSIPERPDLPKSPDAEPQDVTSDLDYYLSFVAKEHENEGRPDLAVACLKKSNQIRMLRKRGYSKRDYYKLPRLLARIGFPEDAYEEKARIDDFFGSYNNDALIGLCADKVRTAIESARFIGTPYIIMSAHEDSCPECAKYQGRVFSITWTRRKYPQIPKEFRKNGTVHAGCRHSFDAYIDGSYSMLDYTLTVQNVQNERYRRNIVSFSNRPFVDDRPKDDIEKARLKQIELKELREQEASFLEGVIDWETWRAGEKDRYKWMQENLPGICPKSYSGFRRMKLNNTENYQKLKGAAAEHGVEI